MTELRVRLTGEHAVLGEVPAVDVARLILEVERALLSSAYAVLQRTRSTGRPKRPIADAVRLRLRAVESGSVVPVMELPDVEADEGTLDLDVEPLGDAALTTLLDAASAPQSAHPAVVAALAEVADTARIGDRYDEVVFEVRRPGRPRRSVGVDATVRRSLHECVDSLPPEATRPDAVIGTLFEANFERNTARLRSPTGQNVDVTFDDEHADDIQLALRRQTAIRGEVVYDPDKQLVQRVFLREFVRGEQLVLPDVDPDDYWRERSLDELAAASGTGEPVSVDAVFDADASDEERDAFMAALADLA
jgi:hypothetical protein